MLSYPNLTLPILSFGGSCQLQIDLWLASGCHSFVEWLPPGYRLSEAWLPGGCHPTKRSEKRGGKGRRKLEHTARCAKRKTVLSRLGLFRLWRRAEGLDAQNLVERGATAALRKGKTDGNGSGTMCSLRFFWSNRPEMKEKQKSLHFPLWRKPRKMENRRMDPLPCVHFRV